MILWIRGILVLLVLVAISLAGCDSNPNTPTSASTPIGDYEPSIPFTSAAFINNQPIPQKHSCDGADVSPPLQWGDTLPDVRSFALIMDDPDASGGTYVHWVVYNLPPTARSLPEGIRPDLEIEGGGLQGSNDSNVMGYGGPCPPGGTHHYHFKLYALSTPVDLPAGATKQQLEQAMKGHVLAYGELVGTYSR
ncbi:MAG: YbhB/YbcL family Raf kinase inhibitor-like protein [Chloroflexia bacterium]